MVIKSAKEDLDAYYSGNTQYYEDEQNLLLNQLEQLNDSDKEKYEKYWNILAYSRNIHMKDTLADSIHNNKHDFIGVGCKHLYGKKGIMQIKEVQEKLKISSYTLRYYEKMGLIQPYRDENGYRNYSEEDIHKIERIMFLRDINVPIEDIKDILNNKVTFQDVLESHIQKVNTEIESLQYIKNMCEDLKEKNIPLLDQVIEGNQIGNEKVKKKDLKKVFDYFKKDQTVVIGYKSIPRSLLGISVLSLFISGIFGILIGLAFPNMISYVNEQTRSSVQHFQIPFYKASGTLIIFSMCI